MKKFTEWLKKRDKAYAEDFAGSPQTMASAMPQTQMQQAPQVQQAQSPFGGVPPQLTQKLQSMGAAGQQVMQRASQAMQQGRQRNMAQALQDAISQYEMETQTQNRGSPPGMANQSQGVV